MLLYLFVITNKGAGAVTLGKLSITHRKLFYAAY